MNTYSVNVNLQLVCILQFVSVLRPPGAMKLAQVDIADLSEEEVNEWKQVSFETIKSMSGL